MEVLLVQGIQPARRNDGNIGTEGWDSTCWRSTFSATAGLEVQPVRSSKSAPLRFVVLAAARYLRKAGLYTRVIGNISSPKSEEGRGYTHLWQANAEILA
jgi:hypothetical protein